MTGKSNLITLYSDVVTREIKWFWYPYIAYGKLTILQGDPGDGKSTMMMHLMTELSTGGALPNGTALGKPQRIIYQCSEAGTCDVVTPRLIKMGANCKNIAFINEEVHDGLTLDDERIREAIISFEPKLVVIDPVQAYIGNESDLQIAARARRLMKRLGMWAETYDCAIVLIGHMNKNEGTKVLYRGLGSIDTIAAVRSVLQVDRDPDDNDVRIVTQIKNNLAYTGRDIRFEIREGSGFKWLVQFGSDKPQAAVVNDGIEAPQFATKQEEAAYLVTQMLKEKDVAAKEIIYRLSLRNIAEKTARSVKESIGARSYRKGRQWLWTLKKEDSTDTD